MTREQRSRRGHGGRLHLLDLGAHTNDDGVRTALGCCITCFFGELDRSISRSVSWAFARSSSPSLPLLLVLVLFGASRSVAPFSSTVAAASATDTL